MGLLVIGIATVAVASHTARAATVNADGTVSVKVNFRYPPQPTDVARLEREMRRAQLMLCDATDGQIKLNNVIVTAGDSGQEGADIWLLPQQARAFAGLQINLYHGAVNGQVIAHEFGHTILGLGEDYEEQYRWGTACGIGPSFDASVRLDETWNSIMQQSGDYFCIDKVSRKYTYEYNPDWFAFACTTDADCAGVCTATGCPTDPAGNLIDFVCPDVPARNSELGTAANHDLRKATGDICPAPKAGRILAINVRLNPNEQRQAEPGSGQPGEQCGNGTVDHGEQCDGTDLAGRSCLSLGFGGGTLRCNANNCSYDKNSCVALATCGNGSFDSGEECEPALGVPTGVSCKSLGFDGVNDTDPSLLSCKSNCAIEVDRCPGARSAFDASTLEKAAATSHFSGEYWVIDSLGRLDPSAPTGGQSSHILRAYFKRIKGDEWDLHIHGRGEEYVGGTKDVPVPIATYRLGFSGTKLATINGLPPLGFPIKIKVGGGTGSTTPAFLAGKLPGDPEAGITAPPVEVELRLAGITREDWLDSRNFRTWSWGKAWKAGNGVFADEPGTAGDMQRGMCDGDKNGVPDDDFCKISWNSQTQRFETADHTLRQASQVQNQGKPVSQWTNVSDWEVMANAVSDRFTAILPEGFPQPQTPSPAACGGQITIPPIPTQDYVYLVMDRSGSMNDLVGKPASGSQTRLEFAQAAARAFIDLNDKQGTQIGMVSFSDTVTEEFALAKIDSGTPTPTGSAAPADLKAKIDAVTGNGWTATGDALNTTVALFGNVSIGGPATKAIVLLSDGEHNTASACSGMPGESAYDACVKAEYEKTMTLLQLSNIPVFTIAAGGAADRSSLAELANATEGRLFDAPNGDELPVTYAEIFARLRGETVALERTASTVQSVDPCIKSGEFKVCEDPSKAPVESGDSCKCLAENEPPPSFPKSETFSIPVETGAARLNVMISTRNDIISDWKPRFELRDPNGNVIASPAHPGLVRSDPFYHIIRVPNPSSGTWTLKHEALSSKVQRSFLLAHVENPKPDCFARAKSLIAKDGESVVIEASAHYDVTLGYGVTMSGSVTRPNGSKFNLNFTHNIDPNTGYRAIIPASQLQGRGVYDVTVRCDVPSTAQPQPGESIFAQYFEPGKEPQDVPAAPDVKPEPFTRTIRTAFFYDSPSSGPLPPGNDCDGDSIFNSQEPEGDLDGDGLPDVCDSDADNDDIPDRDDPDISVPCVLSMTERTFQTCLPGPQQITLGIAATCTGELKSVNGIPLTPAPTIGSTLTLRPGTYVVNYGGRDQTLTLSSVESSGTCCSTGQKVIEGTPLADNVTPTEALGYCVLGYDGADYVYTPDADDTLIGGPGADYLNARGGSNLIVGGPGADFIYGTGRVRAYGGPEADSIQALLADSAELYGGGGQDMLVGGAGPDFLAPGPGSVFAIAGAGDDTLVLYDVCEAAHGLFLDGGIGMDTLITPIPRADLEARGVSLISIEDVIVDSTKRYLSECFR